MGAVDSAETVGTAAAVASAVTTAGKRLLFYSGLQARIVALSGARTNWVALRSDFK